VTERMHASRTFGNGRRFAPGAKASRLPWGEFGKTGRLGQMEEMGGDAGPELCHEDSIDA